MLVSKLKMCIPRLLFELDGPPCKLSEALCCAREVLLSLCEDITRNTGLNMEIFSREKGQNAEREGLVSSVVAGRQAQKGRLLFLYVI